jgi:hypothetical protein
VVRDVGTDEDESRFWEASWELMDLAEARLVDKAFELRLSEFARCRFCRRSTPPERRHGDVCHACAERHFGIIH